jgi:hypothetical protein
LSADDYLASVQWPTEDGRRPPSDAVMKIKVAALENLLRHAYNRGAAAALAPLAEAARESEHLMPDFMRNVFR